MQEIYEKDKYIFVSYAHKDSPTVLPLIDALRKNGYTVWYDQGIEAGTEWPEYIAERIQECGVFLACISPAAMQSNNCRNEINFALSLKKDCLTVYLEETHMTAGMQLQLGSLQALFKYRHKTQASFYDALISATLLQRIQRAPAPIQQEIAPTAPIAKATPAPIAAKPTVTQEKTQGETHAKSGKTILLSIVLCALTIAVDYISMWLGTTYIKNGFFVFLVMVIPSIAMGQIMWASLKKPIRKLTADEQKVVIENICVCVFFMILASLVGDCFLMFNVKKVIFKILISIGINSLRYFILLATLPGETKKEE